MPVPYSEDEARDLLHQGYAPEQVATRTGFPLNWVQRQSVPRESLKVRLSQRGRPNPG